MEQQQKKRDGPVRCVCEERRASEHRKSAESEVVHGSVLLLANTRGIYRVGRGSSFLDPTHPDPQVK